MKSDNTSKLSERSNQRTVLCGEEPTNSPLVSKNGIRLKYADNTFSHYDISTLSCINPIFFAKLIDRQDMEILLPPYITPSLLMEFLFIIKNGFNDLDESTTDNTQQILSLIQVSDFFQNESITIQLINEIVLNKLSSENAFTYLQYSYEKLHKISAEGLESEAVWFDLFYKCLEKIGMRPFLLLQHKDIIDKLDSKVLYELLQKCFAHLILGNYILIGLTANSIDSRMSNNEIEEENYFESANEVSSARNKLNKGNAIGCHKENEEVILINIQQQPSLLQPKTNFTSLHDIEQLIQYLLKVYQCTNNFFDLITFEYMTIFSNNSLKELSESPNPTFEIQIPYEFAPYFYEEYSIDLTINNKRIIIVIFYQHNTDTLNVSIKLSEKTQTDEKFCFQIFTFISIIKLNFDFTLPNSIQTNITSLSNNKSMHCIFTFPNFKSIFKQSIHRDAKNCIVSHSKKYFIGHNGMINNNLSSSNNYSAEEEENSSDEPHDCANDYFTLRIYLKLSFIHSVLASFLLQNFSELAYQPSINKLSKQLFMLIVKNRYLNKNKEDDLLTALVNWLDDEINSKEDISEVIDIIQWGNVTEELLFVFIMKYAHTLCSEQYQEKIIKAIEEKYKLKANHDLSSHSPVKQIMISVLKAAKTVDYNSLYNQTNKDIKLNLAYNANNSNNSNASKSIRAPYDLPSGVSNGKKVFYSQKNENSSGKHLFSSVKNATSNIKASESHNEDKHDLNHFNKLYHSKDDNTVNKFIIHKRNKSPNGMKQQMVSVQTSSLTQFLANHTQEKNNKTKPKFFSSQISAQNHTGKKMSHLKDLSLQLQGNYSSMHSTNKNLINLRTASDLRSNSKNDSGKAEKNIQINSISFSKNNNSRNVKEGKDSDDKAMKTANKTVSSKDKEKQTMNQTNSAKTNKKINLFLKAKSSSILKK